MDYKEQLSFALIGCGILELSRGFFAMKDISSVTEGQDGFYLNMHNGQRFNLDKDDFEKAKKGLKEYHERYK